MLEGVLGAGRWQPQAAVGFAFPLLGAFAKVVAVLSAPQCVQVICFVDMLLGNARGVPRSGI